MPFARLLIFLFIVSSLCACGPALRYPTGSRQAVAQEEALNVELAAKLLQERANRLSRVYTILRTANADLCGQKLVPVLGLRLYDPSTAKNAEQRALLEKIYGRQTDTLIVDVAPYSPGAEAGLKAGDLVLNFGRASKGITNEYSLFPVSAQEIQKAFVDAGGEPMILLIRRGTSMERVTVRSLLGCPFPINIIFMPEFNALSDGQSIVVGTSVFNIASDDSELAFVVAHELAHNVLKHVEKSQGNAAIGGLIGLSLDIAAAAAGVNTQGLGWKTGAQAGMKAYSQEFEREADYLAMFMLTRAGFDTAKPPMLYRRLSAEYPQLITQNYLATHPSNPERIAAMQEALSEIRDKTARGEAILPAAVEGQTLTLRALNQVAPKPDIAVATAQSQAVQPTIPVRSTAFTASTPVSQPIVKPLASPTRPARAVIGIHNYAQLYLIKGRIVSNPPQTFAAEFLEDGTATAILSGRRRLTGNYELFGLDASIKEKYKARLINPDSLKPFAGADAKGFAFLSDVDLQLECAYAVTQSSGRGEGTCADNQGNTYRIAF